MLEKINADLASAMKNQDKFTLSVLRMLKSEITAESRKGSLHELSDDDIIKVIKHQVKVRKDSVKEYEQ
ncbi:MAG: GatB/YqeY domain-containing protein, partial [Bacilli bacterium]|nr:GatB/YqeY domain-containing protein [Bacilli bacterium]